MTISIFLVRYCASLRSRVDGHDETAVFDLAAGHITSGYV